MKKIALGFVVLASMLPMVAGAQVGGNVLGLLGLIETIVGKAIPILVGLALVYFIWGLIRFVISADGEAREDGKKAMWWGIVALFVITSIWGITAFIGTTLGITGEKTVTPPSVGGI